MPAKSKAQQKAAGAALAAKRGQKGAKLKGASRGMAKSMSEKQLKELAGTKRRKLPSRKAAASKASSSSKTSSRKSSSGGRSKSSGSTKRSSSRKKS